MSFHHETVMLQEAIQALNIQENGTYVDCTLGGAGHSEAIAAKLSAQGRLIAFDQDDRALEAAGKRLLNTSAKLEFIRSNFRHLKNELQKLEWPAGSQPITDGVLFDLGVSSPQLDEASRGFSYHLDAPLDMRMDQHAALSAAEVVNEWPEEQIIKILREYGEERFAKRIAQALVHAREQKPITTTTELAELVKHAIPAATRRTGPHPAKRSFQAIRIAVNDELTAFQEAIRDAVDVLKPGGRLVVITFHSLEDRIAKQTIVDLAEGCICPSDFPVCVCNQVPVLRRISRKPVLPSEQEVQQNPRARSAKLRIAEKV